MSKAQKSPPIEDVLSSIRRLVSEEVAITSASDMDIATPEEPEFTPPDVAHIMAVPDIEPDGASGSGDDDAALDDSDTAAEIDDPNALLLTPSLRVVQEPEAAEDDSDDEDDDDDDEGLGSLRLKRRRRRLARLENEADEPETAANGSTLDAIASALHSGADEIEDETPPEGAFAEQDAEPEDHTPEVQGIEGKETASEDDDDSGPVTFARAGDSAYYEDEHSDAEDLNAAVDINLSAIIGGKPRDEAAPKAAAEPENFARVAEEIADQQANAHDEDAAAAEMDEEAEATRPEDVEYAEVEDVDDEALPDEEELTLQDVRDAAEFPADDAYREEELLDEDALRQLVSQFVREELHGALGERITRNVRKLVRREIHRVMSTREFED